MTGRRLDEDWVVIEPDDDLRARIHAWAKKKHINLDALEVAAYKLRDPNRMLRTLSDPEILSAAFPAGTSVPLSRRVYHLPNRRQQHCRWSFKLLSGADSRCFHAA